MSLTVRFLDEKLGRRMGSTEVVADETLVKAWSDAKMVEVVGDDRPKAKALDAPPVDKAIKSGSRITR